MMEFGMEGLYYQSRPPTSGSCPVRSPAPEASFHCRSDRLGSTVHVCDWSTNDVACETFAREHPEVKQPRMKGESGGRGG